MACHWQTWSSHKVGLGTALVMPVGRSTDERLALPLYEAFRFAVTRTRENAWGKAHWTTIWREKPLRSEARAPATA
jgi:hypothetical protein